MKKALLAACLAAGAFLAPHPAAAQTTTVETVLEPPQPAAIHEYIVRERRESVVAPAGFSLSLGVTLPPSIELHAFPATVGVRHRYVVMDNRTVLVDPGTRRVIQIID